MSHFDDIDFYDSPINLMKVENSSVIIDTDPVIFEDKMRAVRLVFFGVGDINVNGNNMNINGVEYSDGDVLNMKRNKNDVYILVEWSDYVRHSRKIVFYEFKCDGVSFQF